MADEVKTRTHGFDHVGLSVATLQARGSSFSHAAVNRAYGGLDLTSLYPCFVCEDGRGGSPVESWRLVSGVRKLLIGESWNPSPPSPDAASS